LSTETNEELETQVSFKTHKMDHTNNTTPQTQAGAALPAGA